MGRPLDAGPFPDPSQPVRAAIIGKGATPHPCAQSANPDCRALSRRLGRSRLGEGRGVAVLTVYVRADLVFGPIAGLSALRFGRRTGRLDVAGFTLGPYGVLMRTLHGCFELAQRPRQMRTGELLQRLGGMVLCEDQPLGCDR